MTVKVLNIDRYVEVRATNSLHQAYLSANIITFVLREQYVRFQIDRDKGIRPWSDFMNLIQRRDL